MLADEAARACLERAGRTADDVNLLINAGDYLDRNVSEPAITAPIQEDIGAPRTCEPAGGSRPSSTRSLGGGRESPACRMEWVSGHEVFLRDLVTSGSMAAVTGSSSAEIHAPLLEVWAVLEDVEKAPEWQGGLKALRALERDGQDRAIRCESETDVKVRTVKSIVHFSYDGPSRLGLEQERGDLKSLRGTWKLEDLGGGRTRATYSLEVELGRMLGMVIRGPLLDLLRDGLIKERAGELKRWVEPG